MAKNNPQDLINKKIFSENLNKYMANKGVRQIDLHNATGIPKSTITGYVKGTSLPTAGNLQKIADFLNVTKSQLDPRFVIDLTESVQKLQTHPTPSTDLPSDLVHLDQKLNTENRSKWVDYGTALLEEQEETVEEVGLTYDVETVSSLAAGLGFSYDDGDTYTVQVTNEPPRHDIASIVSGDSMLPNYHDGDVVYLVDKGISNYSGQVCAVVVNDKTYLKRVYTEPNALRLVSINPKYSDIVIDFPPSEDTHIKIFSVIGSDRTI